MEGSRSSVRDTMKHAGIYSTGAMLGKVLSFLMLPFYAHILRDSGYAVIGMLDAGMALLVSMLAYGTRGASVRLYHDQTDPALKPVVISTGNTIILVTATLLAVPLMIFARPVAGFLLDNPDHDHLLILSLISFILEMGGQAASAWLLIQSQSIKFAAINLLRLVVGLGLNIYLIVILQLGLEGYFVSVVISSALANGLLLYFAYRDCGRRLDRNVARQFRQWMLPLIPGNMVSFASRQIERYLVKFQIDLNSVGLLEMGYKFPVLIAELVTTPFMQSWNTRRLEIAEDDGADRRIGEMFTFYLALALLVGLVMAVVIRPVLIILTPPEFHAAYRIAQVEIATIILNGVYMHVIFGLFYAKHTGTLARIRGWTSALKVGLAYGCISLWGIAGAAWSAAIIGLISVLLGFNLAQRRYKVQYPWPRILLLLGLAGAGFLLLGTWDPAGSPPHDLLVDSWLPALRSGIDATPLGTWKDGKVGMLLAERTGPIAEVLIKGLLAALFALVLPAVHDGSRRRLRNLLPR